VEDGLSFPSESGEGRRGDAGQLVPMLRGGGGQVETQLRKIVKQQADAQKNGGGVCAISGAVWPHAPSQAERGRRPLGQGP